MYELNASQITGSQRNRYALLSDDRISQVDPGHADQSNKSLIYNERFLPTHYEDVPVVPGFATSVAMTQTFLMTFLSLPEMVGERAGLAAYSDVEDRKRRVSGDKIIKDVSLSEFKRGDARGNVVVSLRREIVGSCELTVVVPSVMLKFSPDGARNK
jgi:3-hydroxymyristoyl/3-hydroxydecanoyl-(acyl carrier protein) dehydratase